GPHDAAEQRRLPGAVAQPFRAAGRPPAGLKPCATICRMPDQKLVGVDYTTPDLVAKVTGRAKYAEDYRADGMLFAKLLLSPMPHARVRKIDASEALKMPGVHAILTADELPNVAPPTRTTAAAEEEGPEGGAANKPKPIKPEMGL